MSSKLGRFTIICASKTKDVPMNEMKTTKPRTLIHSMNTHINRWRTNLVAVEKALNELPVSCDQSAEHDHTEKLNDTISDHGS